MDAAVFISRQRASHRRRETHGEVADGTGEEVDCEGVVMLGEETGLEVWAEEELCVCARAEGVVEPALGHGYDAVGGGRREDSGRRVGAAAHWIASLHVTVSGP